MKRVTVYVGRGCHLCARALEVIEEARKEAEFMLEIVDITGDEALEAAHRELLPVVEIDGEHAFHYVVPPAAFRARVA
jgi:glutaredoxin